MKKYWLYQITSVDWRSKETKQYTTFENWMDKVFTLRCGCDLEIMNGGGGEGLYIYLSLNLALTIKNKLWTNSPNHSQSESFLFSGRPSCTIERFRHIFIFMALKWNRLENYHFQRQQWWNKSQRYRFMKITVNTYQVSLWKAFEKYIVKCII